MGGDGDWLGQAIRNMQQGGGALDRVAQLAPQENGGIGVSTVCGQDFGWETALIDANGTHPVERYETKADARQGHEAWVTRARDGLRVTRLGSGDGWMPDEEIEIRAILP